MKILICFQGLFGGTDYLLERFWTWLNNKGIEAKKYIPGKEYEPQNEKFDLVLLPSSQIHYLFKAKKNGASFQKILIWLLGMGTFQESYFNPERSKGIEKYINKYLLKKANSFARKLYDGHSLCYTDLVGMDRTLKQMGISCPVLNEDSIVPIAIRISNRNMHKLPVAEKNFIRIGWVGRVSSDFKLIPILCLMTELNDIENIELTIIGDGDGISAVREKSQYMKYKVRFIKNISYEKLENYINENFDLLFAMGTSALDGAKTGTPTVVISPVRSTDMQKVSYRWIHESKGYSLGEYPGEKSGPEQIKKTLKQILEEYAHENYKLREASYNYALMFDEDRVFEKLLSVIPDDIDEKIWDDIHFFYRLKNIKSIMKNMPGKFNRIIQKS